ncbi:MAG: ParB N-terminal domain-containing protein [Gemmatimonadetes bacterium]|nr:ParB N-terminal domain-containing protein [Gemmatimonadota bacterium]
MEKLPPPFDRAAAKRRLQQRESSVGAVYHAPRHLEGPRAATDHLLLTPDEIVMEGPYVRQHVDEAELEGLKQAILAGGEIKQAIGVRMEGTPLDPRYVLVYGMRRWLASRRAGLERIPVRNHGRITVGESLTLQVAENEARVDPHPVDTAVSYQLLVQEGMSQAAIARVAGRSAAHISYMRAVGEAVLQLSSEERDALYEAPEATVPKFQKIAPLRTVTERAAALRSLLDLDAPSTKPDDRRSVTAFKAGPVKGTSAWSVRVSYSDEELRRDPELAARLERFLSEQLSRVREQIGSANGADAPRRAPVTWELE